MYTFTYNRIISQFVALEYSCKHYLGMTHVAFQSRSGYCRLGRTCYIRTVMKNAGRVRSRKKTTIDCYSKLATQSTWQQAQHMDMIHNMKLSVKHCLHVTLYKKHKKHPNKSNENFYLWYEPGCYLHIAAVVLKPCMST